MELAFIEAVVAGMYAKNVGVSTRLERSRTGRDQRTGADAEKPRSNFRCAATNMRITGG